MSARDCLDEKDQAIEPEDSWRRRVSERNQNEGEEEKSGRERALSERWIAAGGESRIDSLQKIKAPYVRS